MLLTITCTPPQGAAWPATDLGFLLHKNPDRVQAFEQSYGTAHVVYPEATAVRCTAALMLEIDPIRLVRGRSRGTPDFSLGQYVNDRPYAASSLLSVALGAVFRTALHGRCDQRPELVRTALPLRIALPAVPCKGGPKAAERVFAPLGWTVIAEPLPLDPAFSVAESLAQLEAEDEDFRKAALDFCRGLISHYVLDGGRLVVAHAGLKEEYHGRASGRVRTFAMYGESTGETDEYGLPVRYPWAEDYRGRATVLYGHTPVTELRWVNNTLCLDTGVVFGGKLSTLRYPERVPVSVPAERVWYEPVRPLQATTIATPGGVVHRDPGVLDLDDVMGRRVVETRRHGRVGVQEENAGAALEVMSRFAIDPRWLVYLPPTMAPCATTQLDGYLEHPAEAFDYYRSENVRRVVCEEKHMGSRAIVLVTRSARTAADRFGVDDSSTGALYTRTGRPFFDDSAQTEELLARVRAAAETAGLFEELNTDWLLLDTELMPWSAKAVGLLRNQYAAVGAAARAALGTATDLLAAVAARGLDVTDLADRTAARKTDAAAFTAAYGRYCWPVDGLAGLRIAPFQILAGVGINYASRDHDWHLSRIDRLVAADTDLFTPTGRMIVDPTDPDSAAAATTWWTELTTAGGEGMVVKPYEAMVRGDGDHLVQPGVKCRGPEYLRIIYGPEYLRDNNLRRLRTRGLGRKRSMALREYALGLEALDRFVAGEPLWRVHEAVFAVLALESEPVDPRL